MSPKVRLPLVELTRQAKAELVIVVAQISDKHPELVIGRLRLDRRGGYQVAAA
jgi:hypothetical protein